MNSLRILICLARVGNMAPLWLPDPVNKNCHSVWFLKSNWNSSLPTFRSATTVTGATWWPIGLQENNNTFQESWLWVNQQLVKKIDKLLEARNLNIDSKRFQESKMFHQMMFFASKLIKYHAKTYLFETSCYFGTYQQFLRYHCGTLQ